MIELDDVVAIQREVSLNYVEELMKRIPENPTQDQLIDLCISPKQNVPIPKVTQNPMGWVFSSHSVDLRFLGGFLKEHITDDDLKYTSVGSLPTHAITLFVGYGSGSINVYHANGRIILANGFHRVYALKKKGVTKIPVVVKKIGNVSLEFPKELLGLSSEYLLGHPRPITIKDFFNEKLTRVFKRKNMLRTIRVGLGVDTVDFEV